MGETKIEWADFTFNPWTGCTKVSDACKNCYAEAWAKRSGLVRWGDQAERRRTSETYWRQPLNWNRKAICLRCGYAEWDGSDDCRKCGNEFNKRRRPRVFCASLADVFEDHPTIMPGWRADLGRLIQDTPNLDWLLLTKRPENVVRMLPDFWVNFSQPYGMPENVWIGTTVENQEYADKRIPELLKIPARVRFLSIEPLLGPIDLRLIVHFLGGSRAVKDIASDLHWVIVGGESGPRARPSHPDWFRSLRAQCAAAGVPFFFKQHGEFAHWQDIAENVHGKWYEPEWFSSDMPGVWIEPDGRASKQTDSESAEFVYRVGKARAGRLLDGVEHNAFPEVSR